MSAEVKQIPHQEVTKVGSGVTYLDMQKLEGGKKYFRTFRDFGEDAPDPPENPSNPRIPSTSEWTILKDHITTFKSDTKSDVYIFCTSEREDLDGYLSVGQFTGYDLSIAGGSSDPFVLAVSKGDIPGYSIIDKFGLNDVITTTSTPEDVIEIGDIYPEDDFGTAPVISIASTSTSDVGVQVECNLGLDIDGNQVSETYTLDGTNRVDLTTPLWKALSFEVVGSQAPEGDIFIYTGTGDVPSLGDSEVRAYINSDDRRTNLMYITIPNQKVGFLYRGELGIELDAAPSSGGEYARCRYRSKRYDGIFTTKKNITLISNGNCIYKDDRPFPDPIPGLASLKLNVKEVSASMGVWGSAVVLLIDEDLFPTSYLEAIGQPGY